ncbi:hypothetical protein HDV06_003589 [Boothiomyces sp. JEL0866]|nr:hypothetical protein HDV06_003589 [Boothiomyces sp. JEL0866]
MKQLQIRVGTNKDNLKPISPNNEDAPVYIDSDIFTGYIVVRVKGNNGKCSKYFSNKSRMFSMQVSGKFKREFSGDDVHFGAVFDNPIKPPYGTQIGLAVANLIDPSLKADLYSQKPWLLSPLLCSMNVISVQPPAHKNGEEFGSWPWKQGFFGPSIDFNTFKLSLGIHIDINKYVNNQPIRFMAKTTDGQPFFIIEYSQI